MAENAYFGIFNDSFPPILDGVTQTVLNYVDRLIKTGHKACIVTPYNPVKVEEPYPVVRFFSLPIQSRKPYRYGYPRLDPFIWKKLRQTPFALVHSHSPFAAGRLAVYAKRKQNIPLIGTFHSKYKSDLEHSFKYAPWCVPIIMKRILDFYNACDEVWIPQSSVEETIREYGFKGHVEVVENGIDYADIPVNDILKYKEDCRVDLGIDKEELVLLFVGQHIWEKGIGVIAEALSLIKERVKFRMYFIGTGYASEELKKKIEAENLGDKVYFLGTITERDKIGQYYAAADLFLFPSYYDNAPLVVREAAAMGTPSIIPVGSTASEVIKNFENGFLTEAKPQAYADFITQLSRDRSKIETAGIGARQSLVRGWNDVMEEVIDRYNSLIKRYNG